MAELFGMESSLRQAGWLQKRSNADGEPGGFFVAKALNDPECPGFPCRLGLSALTIIVVLFGVAIAALLALATPTSETHFGSRQSWLLNFGSART
jgi:hypothetical protein